MYTELNFVWKSVSVESGEKGREARVEILQNDIGGTGSEGGLNVRWVKGECSVSLMKYTKFSEPF